MSTFFSLTETAVSTGGVKGFNVSKVDTIAVGVTVVAASGTSPKLTVFVEMLGADGNWYQLWTATLTAAGSKFTTIGPGAATAGLAMGTLRFRWAISGTTPSFTFTAFCQGRET